MTAEIAILNRSAVALASDSAVTIETMTGLKIYEGANKLFALIKGQPVGVMIYDSSDHLGVPWETIIKAYRMANRTSSFPELSEYAASFLHFVANSPDLIPQSLHTDYVIEIATNRAQSVVNALNQKVEEHFNGGGRRLSQKTIRAFITDAINEERASWNGRKDGQWKSSLNLPSIRKFHSKEIDVAVSAVLEKLPATVSQRKMIKDLVFESLGKIPIVGQRRAIDPRSGIVIAGFGAQEFFPRLFSYDIYGSVDGVLRSSLDQQWTISVNQPAIIAPFAQREMVDGFMTGINPYLRQGLTQYLQGVTQSFPNAIIELFEDLNGQLSPEIKNSLGGPFSSLILTVVRQLEQHLNELQDQQVQPVLDSVNFLPKDELAAMAESLVNLTSLKRRVSINHPQTVGGPVDVAVISRGDGFVWIKRKHYFSQELNPMWASTHSDG